MKISYYENVNIAKAIQKKVYIKISDLIATE